MTRPTDPALSITDEATLRADRRRLLFEQWSRGQGLPEPETAPKIARSQGPLSYTQRGMWFLDAVRGTTAVNHLTGCFRITGALDTDALQRSLDSLVARHGALRTAWIRDGHQPVQQVFPTATLPLRLLEVTGEADL